MLPLVLRVFIETEPIKLESESESPSESWSSLSNKARVGSSSVQKQGLKHYSIEPTKNNQKKLRTKQGQPSDSLSLSKFNNKDII